MPLAVKLTSGKKELCATNPFKDLPYEIISKILIDYVGPYLLADVRTEEFLKLRLLDRTFGKILRRLSTQMMIAQATYFKGILSQQKHIYSYKDLPDILPNLAILKNPLVPAHQLRHHLNHANQALLIRVWCSSLKFIKVPINHPVQLIWDAGVASSCAYWASADRSFGSCVSILKEPYVDTVSPTGDLKALYAVGRGGKKVLVVRQNDWEEM
ncbi:hypothetical protein HDV00_005267 [Rhizophlyctis rosea]|nr:hypothetical protein HDV00_005267 [Rhizophlyctis rosea]